VTHAIHVFFSQRGFARYLGVDVGTLDIIFSEACRAVFQRQFDRCAVVLDRLADAEKGSRRALPAGSSEDSARIQRGGDGILVNGQTAG
jgi:hypothetical protein